MNKDITLMVLAAGMGSRFGGLKQIEPFGPNGEFIIDYSVYDAIKAGFNKVVFIIKKENIWLYTFYFILLLVFDLWIVDLMLDYLIALIYQQ